CKIGRKRSRRRFSMSMNSTSDDKENDDEGWQHVELENDFSTVLSRFSQQQAGQKFFGKTSLPVHQLASSRTMVDNDIEVIRDVSSDETPSRDELLSIVRKHSTNLGQSESDEKVVDMRFWREMFDMFFIRGMSSSKSRQDDDMIFFVRFTSLHHEYELNDIQGGKAYFVRRWSPKLEKVVGENELEVDWRRSFYLNLIAHTSFKVTVAICSIQALESYQRAPAAPLTPIYKVTKTVYASPSRVNFQLDSKKAVETFPAYPDICFTVDDFDDTFDAVVLTERDHCYCVILNADGGAAFPPENLTQECSSSRRSNVGQIDQSPRASGSKLTLFSGFVSYKMVREAYESGHSKLGSLLFIGNSHAKSERLFMRGPGECGEVEVAVSAVIDQSEQEAEPLSPVQISKGNFKMGIGTIFRVAKQAYVAAAAAKKPESEMLPLRCCLMSISLPWEILARDLLFK
ncbi:hypothetical protein KI387_029054, partial [Taxus chinensis]